jgi:hypothetical protein
MIMGHCVRQEKTHASTLQAYPLALGRGDQPRLGCWKEFSIAPLDRLQNWVHQHGREVGVFRTSDSSVERVSPAVLLPNC